MIGGAPWRTPWITQILLQHFLAREGGNTLWKDVSLPSKHLLSAFYKTLPSKIPSKNLVFTENPLQAPSKNPSKKHSLLENLLTTLPRSVLLHDPLHPIFLCALRIFSGYFLPFTLQGKNDLGNVHFMLVLKGIFGGSRNSGLANGDEYSPFF